MSTSVTAIGQGHTGSPARACVVEADRTVQEWLAARLGDLGIEVCASCGTLADGLEAIHRHQPDIAVVDNRLPDGLGIDLCREISEDLPDVALILHAGIVSPLEQSQAYEAGVTRIALKSIKGDALLMAVTELAGPHRAIEA
jgi:DNA-binding NarL/FixJ family response regulator